MKASPQPSLPKLKKLIIKNFRCIGSTPVEVDLDDIVVLVGPNNVGKSTILKAYEVVMQEGSNGGKLEITDFHKGECTQDNCPEIILETYVSQDCGCAPKWFMADERGTYVRERWQWKEPGKPDRKGFSSERNDWDEERPWGYAQIANGKRPDPQRIDAFASPSKQDAALATLVSTLLTDRALELATRDPDKIQNLRNLVGKIRQEIQGETKKEIDTLAQELTAIIADVFPDYEVTFADPPDYELNIFEWYGKQADLLHLGPRDGYQALPEFQGSGARRLLLWAALKAVSERGQPKKGKASTGNMDVKQHILLMDEPEICLHPNAIRKACRVLYDLASLAGWQVMVTTHSPAFIDIARDNTTIVRVSLEGQTVKSTTVFRPDRAQLSDNDKEQLRFLNACDPFVAEFFFGGYTIIVEGDTEYSAFCKIIADHSDEFNDVHIVRARGKATILTLQKIMNHFGSPYAVLHDSDEPTTSIGNKSGAWTLNSSIRETANESEQEVRVVASIPNFEKAYLESDVKQDKPYNAIQSMNESDQVYKTLLQLLRGLLDKSCDLPTNAVAWQTIGDLEAALGTNGND